MASSLSIELRGADGLKAKLLNLIPRVRAGTSDALDEALLLIESDAKELAPVDTGRLRSSIHREREPGKLLGYVATNVVYAPYLELGTRFIAARPFLFPAYEKNRAAFMAALKRNLKLIYR